MAKYTIYNKTGKAVVEGKEGELTLAITGLAAGTVVAKGDYYATCTVDGVQSDKTDIEGFTVLKAKPNAPQVETLQPTADGASIKFK